MNTVGWFLDCYVFKTCSIESTNILNNFEILVLILVHSENLRQQYFLFYLDHPKMPTLIEWKYFSLGEKSPPESGMAEIKKHRALKSKKIYCYLPLSEIKPCFGSLIFFLNWSYLCPWDGICISEVTYNLNPGICSMWVLIVPPQDNIWTRVYSTLSSSSNWSCFIPFVIINTLSASTVHSIKSCNCGPSINH